MGMFLNLWFWLPLAAFFILAELIVPGGIVIFLGLGALIVAGAILFGFLENGATALTLWFISSLLLILLLRAFAQKVAGGDTSVANTDEKVDAFGEVVHVVETIGPGEQKGRVKFRGTEWQALGDGAVIETGSKATVVSQDNITLIVAPTTSD
ncbi:MAG: NfeD family protein [Gammaproteobacteria bacterium]|nr:NfeD family protein [Gammaproteobacteria bacterium]